MLALIICKANKCKMNLTMITVQEEDLIDRFIGAGY